MSIEQQIRDAQHVVLFLDFDGTLAPIVPRPADAAMLPAIRNSLEILATRQNFTLAFVSGRSAADLEQRAHFVNAIYAGNHGLEIHGPGLNFAAAEDLLLRETVTRLDQAFQGWQGIELEDKMLSASLHFRRVPPAEWPRVEEIVRSIVPEQLTLRPGKMVFEIRPAVDWNKGSAVRWIIGQRHMEQALPVYIGDDVTDEDAFAVLPEGITIHVGSSETTIARYRLRDPDDVSQLLAKLAHE